MLALCAGPAARVVITVLEAVPGQFPDVVAVISAGGAIIVLDAKRDDADDAEMVEVDQLALDVPKRPSQAARELGRRCAGINQGQEDLPLEFLAQSNRPETHPAPPRWGSWVESDHPVGRSALRG